jgi:hypothetical protein
MSKIVEVVRYKGMYTPLKIRLIAEGVYFYDEENIIREWDTIKQAERFLRNLGYDYILVDGETKIYINCKDPREVSV